MTETPAGYIHGATVPNVLPLLAEPFARQRLRALADVGIPTVLFLCTHNAGRSQMALGFFEHFAGGQAVAWSGGSEPGIGVNPAAVEAMAERGIDISREYPKPWTDEIVRAADVIVTMGRSPNSASISSPSGRTSEQTSRRPRDNDRLAGIATLINPCAAARSRAPGHRGGTGRSTRPHRRRWKTTWCLPMACRS